MKEADKIQIDHQTAEAHNALLQGIQHHVRKSVGASNPNTLGSDFLGHAQAALALAQTLEAIK